MSRAEPPLPWLRSKAILALLSALTASVLLLSGQPALAQAEVLIPPIPLPHPARVPTDSGLGGPAPVAANAGEIANIGAADPLEFVLLDDDGEPFPPLEFALIPLLVEGGEPIPEGVSWRVFEGTPGADGTFPLVADLRGGTARLMLIPGRYYLHVMYGWAGATTQILVNSENTNQIVVLNAGGLRLSGLVGDDDPIASDELRFEVFGIDPELGDRVLITDQAHQNQILPVSAGRYHVVSYYGQTNSVVRADIDVEAGKLTELSLYHEAARVTLKLVTVRGGEALANTAWSILTPGGEILFDGVGAFPTAVLAAGEYSAIAKHNDLIYEANFIVETGRDRDVEVLAENPLVPPPSN